jgi:hypothetical protein
MLQCRTPRETNPKGHWGPKYFLRKSLFCFLPGGPGTSWVPQHRKGDPKMRERAFAIPPVHFRGLPTDNLGRSTPTFGSPRPRFMWTSPHKMAAEVPENGCGPHLNDDGNLRKWTDRRQEPLPGLEAPALHKRGVKIFSDRCPRSCPWHHPSPTQCHAGRLQYVVCVHMGSHTHSRQRFGINDGLQTCKIQSGQHN